MQRVTSFILAVLIFSSVVVSAVFVVQQIRKEEKDASQTATTSTDTNNQEPQQEEQVNPNALKGKPMANFTPTKEPLTEIKKIDDVIGTGVEATTASTITFHYTLANMDDGVVRESSLDGGSPITYPLTQLIQGWQEAIPGMKEGGKRRLYIPSDKAYKDGKDLVFDIELVTVK